MKYEDAKKIADKYVNILKPYCSRISVAGSIRRKKPEVKDLEIVCVRGKLLEPLFFKKVNEWQKVKGEPTGKYTQRILPEGIKLDLFMCNEDNWGNIFSVRTGSAEYSHKVLACGWVKAGYKSKDGYLTDCNGKKVPLREEKDLFELINIPYIEPEKRLLELKIIQNE